MTAETRSGFIAIIGRPNAGKSTLLNQVLGTQISIATPKAQTTRERVLGILTDTDEGAPKQIVFIDTPGIHRAKEGGINEYMMREAREALEDPSAIWYLVDPFSEVKHEETVLKLLEKTTAPIFLLHNKSDILSGARRARAQVFVDALEVRMKELGLPLHKVLPISAVKGKGVAALLEETWALIPPGPLYYPDAEQVSDRPVRFFAAEKVREQLLLQLGEELPYCCAVEIEKYEEPKVDSAKPMTRIEAVIHVERDSQKGMVIGKGGAKIKAIGQAAREQIEGFIGGPAFLGLRVDVYRDWSKDSVALKKLGYHFNENTTKQPRKRGS